MRKIKLTVEYDGTPFKGWQRQKETPHTVQGHLEDALKQITGEDIQLYVAGRTDAGVHALGQVCHFETSKTISLRAFKEGINCLTPYTISILKAEEIEGDFHARFSAIAREYEFLIFNRREHSAIHLTKAVHISWPVDIEKMQRAADKLIGEHDFAAFRSADCSSNVTFCRMQLIQIKRDGDFIRIQIKANHFLHNMVRIICGTLIDIGRGHLEESIIEELFTHKDRTKAGVTLGAHGLYFVKAHYEEHHVIDTV